MPGASAGNAIYDPNLLNTGVVTSRSILDGEIVNADVSTSAAIAGSKVQALSVGANAGVIPSTGITTSHIAAAAGIVDTQLATISTAGKVSGAALTLLGNTPAGAGVLPAVNTVGVAVANNTFTKDVSTTTTTVIAHGLGKTPVLVQFNGGQTGIGVDAEMIGNFTAGGQFSIMALAGGDAVDAAAALKMGTDPTNHNHGVVSVDGTNITITWTKTGSPTGTWTVDWWAIG